MDIKVDIEKLKKEIEEDILCIDAGVWENATEKEKVGFIKNIISDIGLDYFTIKL